MSPLFVEERGPQLSPPVSQGTKASEDPVILPVTPQADTERTPSRAQPTRSPPGPWVCPQATHSAFVGFSHSMLCFLQQR